ncbi:MAG: X2-like carbohydrate binding domain-containing protein, partial [Bacillota bacterium]|nr:X2-like carbohydrate binding domain-containing protein [Bacillota bacterium]
PAYDAKTAGEYTFTGTLSVAGASIPDELKTVAVKVTVSQAVVASVGKIDDKTVDYGSPAGLPPTVGVTLNNGDSVTADISWNAGEPAYDAKTAGEYTFTGTLSVAGASIPDELKTVAVKVIVSQAVVASVDSLADISVDYGTSLDTVKTKLPGKVGITLNNGDLSQADITWNSDSTGYSSTIPGSYTFTGTLSLTGVTVPVDKMATVKVNVSYPGTYNITKRDVGGISVSDFTISLNGVPQAAYFNVYYVSEKYLVNPTNSPIEISGKLTSMSVVFGNTDNLQVWVYSDAEGGNKIAEFTLTKDGFLVSNTPMTAIYSVDFNVTDGTNPIAGANVKFNGITKQTGADGHAIFIGVLAGNDKAYSITAAGYYSATGNVTVSSNSIETVVMVLLKTDKPVVPETVRAGDKSISGTAEAGSVITVARGTDIIGTGTALSDGSFVVTLNSGVVLSQGDILLVTAKSAGKQTSDAQSVIVTYGNSTISPLSATFDKRTDSINYTDITITLNLSGNTMTGITNGAYTLVSGTDYTMTGSTVKILKSYLGKLSISTQNMLFSFSAGTSQTLAVSIIDTDSTITPTSASFDPRSGKPNNADIAVTMNLNGNTLTSIKNGSTTLTGTQYTLSGNTVTILKSYLATLNANSTQNLVFSFSAGASQTLTITITDINSTISPTTATFNKHSGRTGNNDITVTMTLNGNTLTNITNGSYTLHSNTDYTISGNTVTIKKSYLGTFAAYSTQYLTFHFSAGANQTLTVTITYN